MAIKLVISGCCGRMGSRIATLALPWYNNPPLEIVGALETKTHPKLGEDLGQVLEGKPLGIRITSDVDQALQQGDVLIEFTNPEATTAHLDVATKLNKAMVIGTTGLSNGDYELIKNASRHIPIVFSPNMSVGVNLMFELVQIATERLGPSYAVEILERHHQEKKDTPSGTAKRLQQLIRTIRQRWSMTNEVPCRSLREGDVVGEHAVVFSGKYEKLSISHEALSRDVFAQGALRAARFVVKQPPGLYGMSDVLSSQ